ncbi:MAG: penicillin-binding protein 1C [candidate division Zixibacteria bacterium]
MNAILKKTRKLGKPIAIAAAIMVLLTMILDRFLFPLPEGNLGKPASTFVYSRDNQLIRCFLSSDGYWRKPVSLSAISPLLRQSVVSREDRWFYYHPGFNPISLFTAAVDNLKAGRIVRGGSTITMQIARMMEPKKRTIGSKIIEIFRAIQLELHYSKDELLELYFNIAPYGGNIEGVGAAAYFYFEKEPSELTPSQAAMLTSIPNLPTLLRPDRNLNNCLVKRDRVLMTMLDRGVIDSSDYLEALDEKINGEKTDPPFLAPHYTTDLALKYPDRSIIRSTIDLKIQSICEGVVENNIDAFRSRGINNAAIVVLDNSKAEVMALVGSADFFDNKSQGQVNGASAARSPGSALKPFVYALAVEEGVLAPNTILNDLPVYYSGYSPENYDRKYRGTVTAASALKQSLNVPAVTLCSRVGMKNFYYLLNKGGISTLNRKYYEYGLPIILGSCEVNLLELTNLYSSLARGGLHLKLKTLKDGSSNDTLRLFSTETSFIISEILAELKRPDFPSCWEFSPNIPKVAWKTGTSYGRKDAWSIGYNSRYTVGVWVGNFSGESSSYLVGAEAAAPVLFEIFESLSGRDDAGWFERPAGVSQRFVCEASGKRPGDLCDVTVGEMYIPGVSPEGKCYIHKEILIDKTTGFRLCKFCVAGKSTNSNIYKDWPPRLMTWLLRTGRILQIPEHNPECSGTSGNDRPVIISPNEEVSYVIREHIPPSQQGILLDASVASSTRNVYWFVDGVLYGTVNPGQKLFFVPEKGVHKLTCSDDRGRSTSININIL